MHIDSQKIKKKKDFLHTLTINVIFISIKYTNIQNLQIKRVITVKLLKTNLSVTSHFLKTKP